jgi:Peptidase family M1 domain
MRKCSFIFFLMIAYSVLNAQVSLHRCGHPSQLKNSHFSRLDTMDIVSQNIYLDFTGFAQSLIVARCTSQISVLQDVDSLHFDFQGLTLDSVWYNGVNLSFSQGATDAWILSAAGNFSGGDTLELVFYYHGVPQSDASWGGFYYNSQYAYNMGVGFDADPHCFGRVWHPCIDDFNDRVQYDMSIETLSNMSGYSGGILVEESILPNGHRLNVWHLSQPVPSYLASVAVSQYVRHESSFVSENGTVKPVWLVSRATDTTHFKSSLVHLPEVLSSYESAFGPYPFDRVGYVAVPFSGGAMEHATNIAYPLFAINGNLTYETLYAHELSHMWWGDAITCATQEDMWLNEGWASYCESLALEYLYGASAYWEEQKSLHKEVMTQAHVQDGGYWPVSGIPHSLTYGTTVYRKGAWVVHNLRRAMGDSSFFAACRDYQDIYHGQSHNSMQLRDFFQNYTSVDLTSFFLTHVFEPGFLGFHVSSWNAFPEFAGGFLVHCVTEQHLRKAPQLAASMPLKLSVWCDDAQWYDFDISQSGESTEHDVHVPAGPIQVVLNRGDALHHATWSDEKYLLSTGIQTMGYPEITWVVNELNADSAWVRAENHLVGEETSPYLPGTDWFISPERFVQLYLDTTQINAGARWNFSSTSSIDLDSAFFAMLWAMNGIEDSLHLLYKDFHGGEWEEYPFYSVNNMGSPTSGTGRFELSKVLPGTYTWAFHTGQIQVDEKSNAALVYSGNEWFSRIYLEEVILMDASGRMIKKYHHVQPLERMDFNWPSGAYLFTYKVEGVEHSQKVLRR